MEFVTILWWNWNSLQKFKRDAEFVTNFCDKFHNQCKILWWIPIKIIADFAMNSFFVTKFYDKFNFHRKSCENFFFVAKFTMNSFFITNFCDKNQIHHKFAMNFVTKKIHRKFPIIIPTVVTFHSKLLDNLKYRIRDEGEICHKFCDEFHIHHKSLR